MPAARSASPCRSSRAPTAPLRWMRARTARRSQHAQPRQRRHHTAAASRHPFTDLRVVEQAATTASCPGVCKSGSEAP
eukprot:6368084-Prymnesium_polylepis.1